MTIRDFKIEDIPNVINILKLNDQYSFPEVDGPEAIKRLWNCKAAIFIVYELNKKVIALIRGTYDGSRAIIHQLSVHPNYQNLGIGTILVKEIVERFKERGSDTASATITKKSSKFWEKVGFKKLDVFLVGNW